MKRYLFYVAVLTCVPVLQCCASTSLKNHAHDGRFYLGGGIGGLNVNHFKEVKDTGYDKHKPKSVFPVLNIFFGYKINQYLRADLNGQFRRLSYKRYYKSSTREYSSKQSINNFSLFINGSVDVPNSTMFTPYATAGVGYARNKTGSFNYTDAITPGLSYTASDNNQGAFAWNLGGGVKFCAYKNFDLDISYKYLDLGKKKTKSTHFNKVAFGSVPAATQYLRMHQVMLNLIFNL